MSAHVLIPSAIVQTRTTEVHVDHLKAVGHVCAAVAHRVSGYEWSTRPLDRVSLGHSDWKFGERRRIRSADDTPTVPH